MEIQQFNQLIELYSERLYRMAYRMVGESHTAEDLVQDTFKSVWKGKAVYDPSMGNNQGAWLFKIMRRRIADFYRGDPAPITISSIEVGVPGYFEDSGFSDEIFLQKVLCRTTESSFHKDIKYIMQFA